MKSLPRLGLVGATGLTGQVFLSIAEKSGLPGPAPRCFASEATAGQTLTFRGQSIPLNALGPGCFADLDCVVFATSAGVSREWAPQAVASGAWVVDKSSAFRLDPGVPLIVPEVNPQHLPAAGPCIIANPNCSTIQLVVVLAPILAALGLKRVIVSSYQSVSGAGKSGTAQLEAEIAGRLPSNPAFPRPILGNVIPQIGPLESDGYCEEESKLMAETRKILDRPDLAITATTVRVPSFVGHGEAVLIETERPTSVAALHELLSGAPGVELHPEAADWPDPLSVAGRDPVAVGRVREAFCDGHSFWLWIVGDNLRKGAALNAWQSVGLLYKV